MTRYYETEDYKVCFHHSGSEHCACNDQLELYINRNWDLKQKLTGEILTRGKKDKLVYVLAMKLKSSGDTFVWGIFPSKRNM